MATVSAFQNVHCTAYKRKTEVVSAHGMTAYEGVKLQLHSFFTKALDRGGSSVSRPGHLDLREIVLGSYLIGGWVDSEPVWTF
jgi:hypothetical protein